MERTPLVYGNGDFSKLICYLIGPRSYHFDNVRDFLASKSGIEPVSRLRGFIGC